MSAISSLTFTRPSLTINSKTLVLLSTDDDGDGESTLRQIYVASLTITILLDALAESYYQGRSYTDDQSAIYRSLESKLNSNFGLEGRPCLQRFICELQKFPIHDWTVVGQLITAVFTPKDDGRSLLHDYVKALRVGQSDDPASCRWRYATACPISLFNYFNPEDDPDQQDEVLTVERGPNDL